MLSWDSDEITELQSRFSSEESNRSYKEVSCRGGRIRPPRARKGFVKLRSSGETFFARITWSEGSTAFSNRGRMHPRHTSLSFPELSVPLQHMPLRHHTFQLSEICAVHDRHHRPPVHIPQGSFQRMIRMQEWHGRYR